MTIKDKLLNELSTHHPYELEYRDCVLEVFNDAIDFDSHYSKAEIEDAFMRLLEPDRIIRFKVEWTDDDENIQVNRG